MQRIWFEDIYDLANVNREDVNNTYIHIVCISGHMVACACNTLNIYHQLFNL